MFDSESIFREQANSTGCKDMTSGSTFKVGLDNAQKKLCHEGPHKAPCSNCPQPK